MPFLTTAGWSPPGTKGACRLVPSARTPATDGGYGQILVEDLRTAVTKAGLRLVPVLVDGPNEFEGAFAAMSRAGAQAVVIQGLFEPQGTTALIELQDTARRIVGNHAYPREVQAIDSLPKPGKIQRFKLRRGA